MDKYGVMKVLECITCNCTIHVRNNVTDVELDKLAYVTEGHVHVWREMKDDEPGKDKSGDVQPE